MRPPALVLAKEVVATGRALGEGADEADDEPLDGGGTVLVVVRSAKV